MVAKVIGYVGTFVLSFIAIWWMYILGPFLEYRYWPVTSKINIEFMQDTPDGVVLQYSYTKYRGYCTLTSQEVYLEREDLLQRVVPRKLDGSRTGHNPVGEFLSDPWLFPRVHVEDLPNLRLIWWHRCHAFWPSYTQVMP